MMSVHPSWIEWREPQEFLSLYTRDDFVTVNQAAVLTEVSLFHLRLLCRRYRWRIHDLLKQHRAAGADGWGALTPEDLERHGSELPCVWDGDAHPRTRRYLILRAALESYPWNRRDPETGELPINPETGRARRGRPVGPVSKAYRQRIPLEKRRGSVGARLQELSGLEQRADSGSGTR